MGKFQWDYMINCHENENGNKNIDSMINRLRCRHGHKYTKYCITRQDHVYI